MSLYALHKNTIKKNLLTFLLYILYFIYISGITGNDYGSISSSEYLTGKFNPANNELFAELGDMGIPTNGRRQYLRQEAAQALKLLYQDFRNAHPDAPFWIQSSTRNFWDQKKIWEDKWNGNTRVDGKKLNQSISNHKKRAKKILEYSSMPGTSRHHWGSDLDFNQLYNGYYETGEGKILFDWLIQNAPKYGFCQPYTSGRSGGYNEERWHWSYKPLSERFLKDWNQIFADGKAKLNGFSGWEAGRDVAGEYVNNINSECL